MLYLLLKAQSKNSLLTGFGGGLLFSAIWFVAEEVFAQIVFAVCVSIVFGTPTTQKGLLSRRHVLVWNGFTAGAAIGLLVFYNLNFKGAILLPALPETILQLMAAFILMQLYAVFQMASSAVPSHKQGARYWIVRQSGLLVLTFAPLMILGWIFSHDLVSFQVTKGLFCRSEFNIWRSL